MRPPLRPKPAEFQRCVRFLCTRIGNIAARFGVADVHCSDLPWSLAAMPPPARDRVRRMLSSLAAQAEDLEPVMVFATRYILVLAEDIWETNPHFLTHAPVTPEPRRTIN